MVSEQRLQVTALQRGRTMDQRSRGFSLSSFYKTDSDSNESLRAFSDVSLVGDYPTNKKGQHTMPRNTIDGGFKKNFRKDLKKVVKRERSLRCSERRCLTGKCNQYAVMQFYVLSC